MSTRQIETLIADWDGAGAELKTLLRRQPAAVLAKRPPSGDWSIVENVRHLIFAEQIHLERFSPTPVRFSAYGLVERTNGFPEVGSKATTAIDVLLREWDRVHRPLVRSVRSAEGDVAYRLGRHIKHLRRHITMIERALRKVERASR